MAAKDERGRAGEERAAAYLRARGYEVVDRNWRCEAGELDIVAVQGDCVVVVEVKTRRSDAFGHPLEAVDRRKARRLQHLALRWAAAHPDVARRARLRVDVIAVLGEDPATGEVEHLVDGL